MPQHQSCKKRLRQAEKANAMNRAARAEIRASLKVIRTATSKDAALAEMPKLSVGARWHHERFDGTGYPDGLVGEEIPEEARIIAVADAYDAMSSNRSYRNIMSQERIREEIINGSGTQFDPRFAEIMLRMIEEDPDYRMREGGHE